MRYFCINSPGKLFIRTTSYHIIIRLVKKYYSFNSSNMMITPITLHVYYFITTNTKPFFKINFKY